VHKHHALYVYGAVKVYNLVFLTSALDGGEWSSSRLGHINSGIHLVGDHVSPRMSLYTVEKRKVSYSYQELNPSV
jgi:hypothetical protein